MTESSGPVSATFGPEEMVRYGSVGRISENLEAKIVDPSTGEALPPGKTGELWLRGPVIMTGNPIVEEHGKSFSLPFFSLSLSVLSLCIVNDIAYKNLGQVILESNFSSRF